MKPISKLLSLLLCLTLLAGLLVPVAAAEGEAAPDGVVLTVVDGVNSYEYTKAELQALAKANTAPVGYQYWNLKPEKLTNGLLVGTEYVTIPDLLADAGIVFDEGDAVTAIADGDSSAVLNYADMQTCRYYIPDKNDPSSAEPVPAALLLSWASGDPTSATFEQIAAKSADTGNLRFAYGISLDQVDDTVAAGARLVQHVVTLEVTHTAQYTEFTDLPAGAWYEAPVSYVLEHGLMDGTGNGLFSPERRTTRAMVVTTLYRLAQMPKVSKANSFTDVSDGMWYTRPISWAEENGIVDGYGDGTFRPNQDVSREQLALIFCRYAQYQGQTVTASAAALDAFADKAQIHTWAADALAWAVETKLVEGRAGDRIVPLDGAKRTELAAMLQRYLGEQANE